MKRDYKQACELIKERIQESGEMDWDDFEDNAFEKGFKLIEKILTEEIDIDEHDCIYANLDRFCEGLCDYLRMG